VGCCFAGAAFAPFLVCYGLGLICDCCCCAPALDCYRGKVEPHVDACRFAKQLRQSNEMRAFVDARKALVQWTLDELDHFQKKEKAEEQEKKGKKFGILKIL
jgi:hypothetical protein